jgi:hypothetical protein
MIQASTRCQQVNITVRDEHGLTNMGKYAHQQWGEYVTNRGNKWFTISR